MSETRTLNLSVEFVGINVTVDLQGGGMKQSGSSIPVIWTTVLKCLDSALSSAFNIYAFGGGA